MPFSSAWLSAPRSSCLWPTVRWLDRSYCRPTCKNCFVWPSCPQFHGAHAEILQFLDLGAKSRQASSSMSTVVCLPTLCAHTSFNPVHVMLQRSGPRLHPQFRSVGPCFASAGKRTHVKRTRCLPPEDWTLARRRRW